MSEPLSGAIVGFGRVAEHAHLPALLRHPRVRLDAIVDRRSGRRERARRILGSQVRVYADIDELLEHGKPSFVDVATPPTARVDVISSAAAAGVHVLAEKPLAVSAEAMRAIAEAAGRFRIVLMTVHNWHHSPAERVNAGAVGGLREIEFHTHRTQPAGGPNSWRLRAARAGGGILTDHGWHALYLAQSIARSRPVSAVATTATRRWLQADVEDTARCRVTFANGVRLVLDLTWAADRRGTRVRVVGDGGSIEIEDGTVIVRDTDGREQNRRRPDDASDDSYHASWFPPVLEDFIAAVERPQHAIDNFGEAALCRAVIDAAYESARREGALVAVDGHDFLARYVDGAKGARSETDGLNALVVTDRRERKTP